MAKVAEIKGKVLFIDTIFILPRARVRVRHAVKKRGRREKNVFHFPKKPFFTRATTFLSWSETVR